MTFANTATFWERYDALIVNGEGSMHHSKPNFRKKMDILQKAVGEGIPAYLVNTVWQSNSHEYDDILKKLSGIVVREKLSQNELAFSHGVASSLALDASYFVGPTFSRDDKTTRKGVAYTDFRCPERDAFFPDYWMFPDADYLSLKANSWSDMVTKLSTYEYVVTGQHHAMYAACKARTPFIVSGGNSHKIQGLFATAEVDIPIAKTPEDFPFLLGRVENYRDQYTKLFDWMGAQSPKALLPKLV